MEENENKIITKLTELVDSILSDNPKQIATEDITEDTIANPALKELARKIIILKKQYAESYDFIVDLSKGKLETSPPRLNSFANPFKQLQSELRHLVWQSQEIADGDYDQSVSFSGDFSRAFNKMIIALRERQNLVELNKEKEEQLIKYAQELKDSNSSKDILFSIIAHDLKNPFNSLLGFSELLSDDVKEGNYEEIGYYSELISESAKRAYNLLVNLLDWSRLQTGKISVNPESINLKDLIIQNIKVTDISAKEKDLTIIFDETRQYPIVTDKTILNTVLRNLINNAIKYTPTGGQIRLIVDRHADSYHISIQDNGIGMKEEHCIKLFKVDKVQSTPGTNNEKGTGLGLILCNDFVSLLGGQIKVQSTYGKGTTFVVSLPVVAK